MIENEARGFFTGPGLDGPQARCVYLTAIELGEILELILEIKIRVVHYLASCQVEI